MFKEIGAMMKLLGNRGQMAEEMQKFQATVAQITVEANAGGGMVTVKVNGKLEVLSCKIAEDAMKLNDREMLEDLMVAATNQALNKVREQLAAESAKMASGMGLPPGLLGGGLPGVG